MEIIIPAAGLSTRFPKGKPKFMLYDYSGKSMLYRAVEPFLGKYKIHIGILNEHEEMFNVSDFVRHEFENLVNIIVIPERTSGPAHTVDQIIELAGISNNTPILVKDCDSFFNHHAVSGSYICVSRLSKTPLIFNPANKSYVLVNDTEIVQKIIEKEVVSDIYCVGGYKFEAAHFFRTAFHEVRALYEGEIFVSHVIKSLLHKNHPFSIVHVSDYADVGTMQDWLEYNNKPVIFCDVDGTIIKNQQRYGSNSYDKDPVPLENNIKAIIKMQNNGSQIIFTTARPEESRQVTQQMLESLGFKNFQLLMNLNNAARTLINDYNEMNPYPRATAINIKRNSDNLSDFL